MWNIHSIRNNENTGDGQGSSLFEDGQGSIRSEDVQGSTLSENGHEFTLSEDGQGSTLSEGGQGVTLSEDGQGSTPLERSTCCHIYEPCFATGLFNLFSFSFAHISCTISFIYSVSNYNWTRNWLPVSPSYCVPKADVFPSYTPNLLSPSQRRSEKHPGLRLHSKLNGFLSRNIPNMGNHRI